MNGADPAQRETLADALVELIAMAVEDARLPGAIYGLVLAYADGGLATHVYPLYEVTRRAMLDAGVEAYGLWDPSWADDYALPPGAPPEMPDRDIEADPYRDHRLRELYEVYRGSPRDSDEALARVDELWLEVAVALTRRDWREHMEITDDFVALAYPQEWLDNDIVRALQRSLGPERFDQLRARGLAPG